MNTDDFVEHTGSCKNYCNGCYDDMEKLLTEVRRLREWENRIRTYFGDEEMMDFYDWMKEKYGEEE